MNKLKQILVSLITNPILLMAYVFFFYKLAQICKYGRQNYNLQVLILLTIFFILVIIITSIKIMKNKKDNLSKLATSKPWKYTSIALIIAITSFYGYNIYKSSVNFGGKLSWFILRAKTERSVEFEHNNFYKYGVAGIFNDINEKYPLPKKLYISNEFQLQFNSDGKITDLYAFVYGKNKDGQEKSYLITYDNKSNKMTIRLDGVVNGDYNEDNLLDPLVETVRAINIKKSYLKNNEKEYGLLYSGKRSWGYDTTGLINIYEDGHEVKLEDIYNMYLEKFSGEITGYSVSLYIPNKKEEITPFRYNLINDTDWSKSQNILPGDNPNKEEEKPDEFNNPNKSGKEEFYLSEKIGYKLNPVDAALGSIFYELIKTTDGGVTTSIFDFPTVPYKEGGVLKMIVGQGQDGDYNGDKGVLYESKDNGKTWAKSQSTI